MKFSRLPSTPSQTLYIPIVLLSCIFLPTSTLAQTSPLDSSIELVDAQSAPITEDIIVVADRPSKLTYTSGPIATLMSPQIDLETVEQRLDRIAYYLRVASGDWCSRPEMLTGFSLHDTGSYDADQRGLVESHYRMGQGFGVRHLVVQSAAARAGFLAGDVITHVNGQDVTSFESNLIGQRATYKRTVKFEEFLSATLESGPAELTIKRGAATSKLVLPGLSGCGGKPVLYDKGGLNAWSDGKYLAVTETMMKFAGDDDELAFVVAHEMAHNILRHAYKLRGKSMLLASFGIGSGAIKNAEIEADQLGAQILVSAGFPIDGAISLLKRAGAKIPFYFATTHPGIKRRMDIVRVAALRFENTGLIARQQREQPPLIAGMKDLAFIAKSVIIPESVLRLIPSLSAMKAQLNAQPETNLKDTKLASWPDAGKQQNGITSISFANNQATNSTAAFNYPRTGNVELTNK